MTQNDRIGCPGRTIPMNDRKIGPADGSIANLQDHMTRLNLGFFDIAEG